VWFAVPGLLLVMLFVGSGLVTTPYDAIAPGLAEPVAPLIHLPGGPAKRVKGQILLTTVEIGPVRVPELVRDWLDPNVQLQKRQVSPRKEQQQNVQEMADSEQAAVVVALRRLGRAVDETGTGALVEVVYNGTPAAGRLKAGEVIVAIDGRPTLLEADAAGILRQHRPGDVVALTVDPGGGRPTRVEQIALTGHQVSLPQTSCASAPGTTTVALLGVGLGTRNDKVDLPERITIDPQGIGGPSAGLAFTLGIIAQLTSSDLSGGHKIAATGAISTDGTVGDVGGVPQKTVAVRRAGADLFIVPCGELHDAQSKAGKHLRVVAVATLEQALGVLRADGGTMGNLPPAPATLLR